MTNYTYSRTFALVPSGTSTKLAQSATGKIYDINDTARMTPLNLTLVIGGAAVTQISTDSNGQLPDFFTATRTSVVWKDNATGLETVLTTTDPIQGPPGDLSTWKPNVSYLSGQTIINPSGDIVTAKAAFTAGASYDASKWSSSTGRIAAVEAANSVQDGRLTAVESKNAAQDTAISNAQTNAVASAKTYTDGQVSSDRTRLDGQDGRLSLLENAAGFTAPPLGFQDSVVKALVNNTASDTSAALVSQFPKKGHLILNVRDYGAVVDGSTDDSAAILSTMGASPAAIEWGAGTYYVPSSANIAGLEAFNHSGTAVILKGSNSFYIGGKRSKSQRNILYVDPAGLDTNDGLHASTPLKTLAKAAAIINAWADNGLKGLWRVQLAAGTYTQDRFLLNSMVKSDYPIEVRGPDVGGHPNVPTAIIDNTGGTSDDIFSTGYNSWLNIQDVKVINHVSGSAFHASRSMLNLTNCHVSNVYTGAVYEHNSGLGLFGGLWDGGNIALGAGIRGYYGSTHNLVTTDLTTSALFSNWVTGLQIGEGSFGHLDYVRIQDCTVGIQFNRVDSGANTKGVQIWRCGTGIQAYNSAWFNNIIDFGLGTANACTVTVDERGDAPEYTYRVLNNTSRTIRQMDTYRGATRTGNTNKNAEYTTLTIPKGRMSSAGLRTGHTTRVTGAAITTVSAGSTITLSYRLGSVTTDEVSVVIPAGGAVSRTSFVLEIVSFATNSHRMVLTANTPAGTSVIGYKEVAADSNAADLALVMYYQLGNVADSFSIISATCSTTVGG